MGVFIVSVQMIVEEGENSEKSISFPFFRASFGSNPNTSQVEEVLFFIFPFHGKKRRLGWLFQRR